MCVIYKAIHSTAHMIYIYRNPEVDKLIVRN